MKKIFYLILILAFTYLFLNFIIGNDNLKNIKDLIPNYFNWKSSVKSIFFPNKTRKILIKTDGLESFNLSKENKIFIYSNSKKNSKLFIKGVLKNENILCLNKNFTGSFVINLKDLDPKCDEAIYFIGQTKKEFFYFSLKKSKKKTKNLLVLPTTNFYDYSSNLHGFNQHSTFIDYVAKLDEIPQSYSMGWALKTSLSIHNINKVINDFDVILDYKFEKTSLENYDLIIFPLHQEKVSEKFLEKLTQFLSNKNKRVLSIGGANYFREVKFKENLIIYNEKYYSNFKKYNLPSWDYELNKNCYFEDDKRFELGEISQPLDQDKTDYYFYKINCDNSKFVSEFEKKDIWDPNRIVNFIDKSNNVKLPLLSITKFENNGKLLHVMTDGIGINFSDISYLKSKISEEILTNN